EQVEPFAAGGRIAGVVHVEQHRVEVAALEERERRTRRAHRLDVEAGALEEQAKRLEHVGLVVGDEDARLIGHWAWIVARGSEDSRRRGGRAASGKVRAPARLALSVGASRR